MHTAFAPPAALHTLQHVFGYPAFRGEQQTIVEHLTNGGDALVLMPTGGGKSLCFQIPALLREGTAIVVSPLIALMQDQVSALVEAGVKAAFLNSSQGVDTARAVERALYAGELDLLYVAPERLMTPRFLDQLDHLRDMLDDAIASKKLPFRTVLMDSWYATKDVMMHIDRADKIFYCPLKSNRKVDDASGKGKAAYKAVSALEWSEHENMHGKLVKIHEFPGDKKVKLFRVAATNRTEWIATNDLSQNSMLNTHEMCAVRWKIEQYHREVKQTLGIEKCQCRTAGAQKNHIGCVILVWNHLTKLARKVGTSIYALKKGLISDYMKNELANPSIRMASV